MRLHTTLFFPIFAALTSVASAQGSDDCSAAAASSAISGLGTFAMTNAGATNGLPDATGCVNTQLDVWFYWTATATGVVNLSFCAGATDDTVVSVWADGGTPGSCPTGSTAIACNDDFCGLQTELTFPAVNGTSYFLQLGAYGAATTYAATFTISPVAPLAVLDTRVNPANGHTYHLLADASWSVAEARAVELGGHLATVRSQAEHDWIAAQWHNFGGVDIDLWIGFNDTAVEGTFVWSSGEPVTYSNWDAGEPNNAGGGEDVTNMRFNNPLALWNDLPDAGTGFHFDTHGVVEISSTPATLFCPGDGSGTACPCANNSAVGADVGCLSSLGTGGQLRAVGNASIATDTLVLQGSALPSAPCLYFQGTTRLAGGAGAAFGDGLRCAGGTIIRLGTKTSVAGASQYPAAGDVPISIRGANSAGVLRTYQLWYRNAAAFCTTGTFNLTNGVELTWGL